MRLPRFIRENIEGILQEWEDFAVSVHSAPQSMDKAALRDHARLMLHAIADDIETPQTHAEQLQKSRGLAPRGRETTAAEAHGGDRMAWAFSIGDMVSEFRALRASVIRLWGDADEALNVDDVIRFNEAMDQALAESVESYVRESEQQQRLLAAMLENSSDPSFIFDREGSFLYVNRAMANVYGRHPSEMIGKRIDVFDASLAAEANRHARHVIDAGKAFRGELSNPSAPGAERVIEYRFTPIRGDNGRIAAVAGNTHDITDRRNWERTLWRHANHDHLTGIPNRRLFSDRLEQDLKRMKRSHGLLALLYIDLDSFKEANDFLGHDGGDALLKETARRIATCIRETDTVARLGGDEFAVILAGAGDENHVEAVARAILTRLARPFAVDSETVRITASIGVACYPEHGDAPDVLMLHADQAMYAAKKDGGDRFSIHSSREGVDRQADHRHAVRGDLH